MDRHAAGIPQRNREQLRRVHAVGYFSTARVISIASFHCLILLCRWCSSSLSGGVRPNLQHHSDWLLSQMTISRADFDQEHPGAEYDASQHVQYMIRTFRSRYPGIRFARPEQFTLNIDRDRVVDSTVEQISCVADEDMPDATNIKVQFNDQEGYDAGGLTDDWLSMFMLEAMDPYRQPPLFLLPRQIDGLKEAFCVRLNHSLHAFGITADRERAIMRTFGFVLAACLKRGRFACNKYMLSKSLLQRLLGQDLPEGLLGLKEEFPDEYQVRWTAAHFYYAVKSVLVARGLVQAP